MIFSLQMLLRKLSTCWDSWTFFEAFRTYQERNNDKTRDCLIAMVEHLKTFGSVPAHTSRICSTSIREKHLRNSLNISAQFDSKGYSFEENFKVHWQSSRGRVWPCHSLSSVFSWKLHSLFLMICHRERLYLMKKTINFSTHPESKINIVQNAVEVYYPIKTLHLK